LRHGDLIVAKVSVDGFISGSRNNGFVLLPRLWTGQIKHSAVSIMAGVHNWGTEILHTTTALIVKITSEVWNDWTLELHEALDGTLLSPYFVVIGQSFFYAWSWLVNHSKCV
jgi:hypothetical protein